MVVMLAYTIGLFFYLFVQIEEAVYQSRTPLRSHGDLFSFAHEHDMHANSHARNTIIMIYYSLTTLSSVGFGDYSPVTPAEQCFIIGVFMIQLINFSLIIDSLQGYFLDYKASNDDRDESQKLKLFFQMLK